MPVQVGAVVELWRYPVKSLGGERCDSVVIGTRGVEHDRWWSVCGGDGKFASGKSTRRFRRMPGLLSMKSFVDTTGSASIRFSDGDVGRIDDPATARRVSEIVGEDVDIVVEAQTSHFDDSPVHILSLQSLSWLDARVEGQIDGRRFRPNIVVDVRDSDGRPEDGWTERKLAIGSAVLRVTHPTVRCAMAAQSQDELAFAPAILQELEAACEMRLGMYTQVDKPGAVRLGEEVWLL